MPWVAALSFSYMVVLSTTRGAYTPSISVQATKPHAEAQKPSVGNRDLLFNVSESAERIGGGELSRRHDPGIGVVTSSACKRLSQMPKHRSRSGTGAAQSATGGTGMSTRVRNRSWPFGARLASPAPALSLHPPWCAETPVCAPQYSTGALQTCRAALWARRAACTYLYADALRTASQANWQCEPNKVGNVN
jgi:hypothetical protein